MSDLFDAISNWFSGMPLGVLYAVLGVVAFVEGIFPPVPADLVVALGSFLAARRGANFEMTAGSIVVGSVSGSMVVYAVARKFGAEWLHRRLRKLGIDNLEQRLEVMYSRYGLLALFVSRFVPGLRAISSPMAGATRIPAIRTATVFLVASSIWYGAIAWLSFRVGDDWDSLHTSVGRFARDAGAAAVIAALLFVVVVLVVVRRRAAHRARQAQPESRPTEP